MCCTCQLPHIHVILSKCGADSCFNTLKTVELAAQALLQLRVSVKDGYYGTEAEIRLWMYCHR